MQAIGCNIPHFYTSHWSSSVEFEITGYYNPGWLLRADS